MTDMTGAMEEVEVVAAGERQVCWKSQGLPGPVHLDTICCLLHERIVSRAFLLDDSMTWTQI